MQELTDSATRDEVAWNNCPPEVGFLMESPRQHQQQKASVLQIYVGDSRRRGIEMPNAEVYVVTSDAG